MKSISLEGMNLLRFELLSEQAGLVHAVTTRPHNLAPHRAADRELATENRRRLCAALGLEFDKLTAATQMHGAEVLPVAEGDAGRGREGRHNAVPFVDGLITDRRGVGLLSMSADCPTVLVYDPAHRAVGVAHASWRGTLGGIAANLVAQMQRSFGCRPSDLMAGIGPSAGPCCYEVKDDVRRVAATRLEHVHRLIPSRGGRFFLDLWATLESQLLEAGVPQANIEQARLCTMCDQRFFSHRRDGASTGRFGLLGALKPVQ